MINFYKVLGLHRQSSHDEIKQAWRVHARATHPDRPEGDGGNHESFIQGSRAYNTLVNSTTKYTYDRSLELTGARCSTCAGSGFRARSKGGFSGTHTMTPCVTCEGCGFVNLPNA